MSTEARTAPSGGRESAESLSPQPYPPHFYPAASYQGPPQPPWFPPGQTPVTGSSGPWPGPWGYPGTVPGWTGAPLAGKVCPTTNSATITSDEYTVDTMRRIYNDDDGRVEIQRVKVQRRQPETSTAAFPTGPDAMSLVPVGTFPLNERRPPPRKNKLKRQMQLMQSMQGQQQGQQQGAHPWYPCMPYMPYPYPYPYYYGGGCVWPPPPSVPPPPMTPWPGSDDSERTTSRQESLPTTLDSQRLDSRVSAPSSNSHSPLSQRSLSPTATTHSIAPSDSASVWECSLRGPTPPPRTKSRASIERRARAIMAPSDFTSDAGDKSSYSSASTDIVPYQKLPPKRKKRKSKTLSISDKSSSLDQKDTDSLSDKISVVSDMTCDESRLSSELNYTFRKFENSIDVFKTKVSVDSTPVNTPPQSPSPIIVHSSDTATPTGGAMDVAPSEHMKDGDDTDTYIQKSNKLEDQEPSTESFSSLPLLETAPLESLSSTTSKKVLETTVSPNVPMACDSKHEENLAVTGGNENVPESTTTTISTTTAAMGITATTTKDTEDVKQPSVATSGQESNSSISITNADVSNTSGTPTAHTVLSSEQISAQDSQTTTIMKEKAEKESESIAERQEMSRMELDASSGRDSRASSSTFFSIRPSDDPLHFDTDSTDILLPTTDATTADEGGEGTDWTASSPVVEDTESYQWVLQQPGEIPDLACSTADKEDERRNAWRAEVSLWRARLVVSLCRGRGLDRQDWATFHLLVHHPLTLDLKLSMLHASRLCVANSTTGAALVRVALIHLAQHGETLLQPEASRQLGWRSIKVDPNQSWAPVKGAVEILKALGYREREDGVLRYPRRSGPEVSVLARLTLDMLVLAEEFRLYLTGTHQYPTNISNLFFPASISTPAPLDGTQLAQDLPRPPSSVGSYSFMSAQSSTSLNHRPGSQASSVTDEDTETLQASVRQAKSHSKKNKQTSSSEEEITLMEDLTGKSPASQEVMAITHELKERAEDKSHPSSSDISSTNRNLQPPGTTISLPMSSLLDQSTTSLDMSSLPDLQSIKSSTLSLVSQPLKSSESNGSITPVATPLPDKEETKDNPEEHIYEEIDVIRQQVQALRASSVPVDSAPPPLPPKKKVSSGGEDDSGLSLTYPHMEWTTTSMPGSLRGGSTGARRKKRRAPMPPDFMPPDWKPYENRSQESPKNVDQERSGSSKKDYAACQKKTKGEYRRTLNPFYEDIDSVKAQVKELNKASERKAKSPLAEDEDKVNPFDQDEYVVSGYIGKNPFYEDIDENSVLESQKRVSHSAAPSPKLGGSNVCAMGSLSELQDESVMIKAKRRAPKPPTTPIPSNRSNTPQPPKSPSSPQPPKHPNTPPPNPPSSPHPPKSPSIPQPPKSTSSPQPTKQLSTTPPLSPPAQQQQVTDVDKQKVSSEKKPNLIDESSTQGQNTSNKPVPVEILANTNQQNSTAADENKLKEPTPCGKDPTSAEKAGARKIVSSAIKASLQRLSLHHPTIPPPPPPPKFEDDEEPPISILAERPLNGTASAERPLNGTASQNTTQSLLDDIPYMDANEVKSENVKASQPKVPPSPQYEIPALPGKDGIPVAPPLSPATMRQTALLLSGHRSVPFIDESDLPPDCPPPPPPTSPPESPPETPKASPPETPHVSPPETPHASPPSSPLTIRQIAPTTAAGVPLQEEIRSNSQSTEQTVEVTKKDILTAPESDASADSKSHPSTIPENKPSTAPESAPLIGSETTQLTPQVSDPSTIPESKPSTAPETSQLTAQVNDLPIVPETNTSIASETSQLPAQVNDSPIVPETNPPTAPETSQLPAQVNDSPIVPETNPSITPESNPPLKEKVTIMLPLTPVQKEVKPNDSEEEATQGPPLPPKTIQSKYSNLTPQAASSSAEPCTNQTIQSSKSEDKYDSSEGPIHSPVLFGASDESTTKAGTTEESAKNSSETTKPEGAPSEGEVDEERYEIPEVVKETALSIGPEGMPVRVGGPPQVHRLDMESVFGPPKPPRRRRNLSLPPPRPPKNLSQDDTGVPKLPPKANTAVRPASASTTASFVTAATSSLSGTPTSLRGTPKIKFIKNRSKTRRSWPLLFCDCMYVNYKNYDDMGQK